ncbi:MAG TPA: 2-amino-4-hydroxy-6-hydroxymethyldihydropteridine diphosphokinase [Candidatus Limnocylindrales bacterium]|nr:2-amino-4-hydroxy-6-hydroxymethyldihydropteridine diphosphokinase [Candidatus Limnocylindrales bacterium]
MSARPTVRAYIGLGANLGDAAATMAAGIGALDELPDVRVRDVSRLYATAPWGFADQPEFRNAAVAVDVSPGSAGAEADALDLLASLKEIERTGGRQARARWGPRELDLDLLLYGRHRIDVDRSADARSIDADVDPVKAAKRLEVPHRHLRERLFVLAPLADLAPGLVPPGWTETIETRRRLVAAGEAPGSVRVVGAWDPASRRWLTAEARPAERSGGAT